MHEMISPKVHRGLNQYSISKFLQSKRINVFEKAEKLEIGLEISKLCFSHILDDCLENNEINDEDVNKFILNQFRYGYMRNVYVDFIDFSEDILVEKQILACINRLIEHDFKNSDIITGSPFLMDIRRNISPGEKKILYYDITKDEQNIQKVSLLLAKGIITHDGRESIDYYPIDLDFKKKLLVIRIRNWENNQLKDNKIDLIYQQLKYYIVKVFPIVIEPMISKPQIIINKMLSDLTGSVLKEPIQIVNSKLEEVVRSQLPTWTKEIIKEGHELPKAEYDVLTGVLLNNFYKIFMLNNMDTIKTKELKKRFQVDGYPRYIRFVDDTISEGRAKSSSPYESLLDTSIYYDVKARLEQAKQIKMSTIYWLDVDSEYKKPVGISFYTDAQNRFKFISLPYYFSEEMCEYVLRKIRKYSA